MTRMQSFMEDTLAAAQTNGEKVRPSTVKDSTFFLNPNSQPCAMVGVQRNMCGVTHRHEH